jgi:hypothetical protein
MAFFKSQCLSYLAKDNFSAYFYKVYQNEDKQNYAWQVETTEIGHYMYAPDNTPYVHYSWEIYHIIEFHFSNGYFKLIVSDHEFSYWEVPQKTYHVKRDKSIEETWSGIDVALTTCQQEAVLAWKKYGKEPVYMGKPFSYYFLFSNHYHEAQQAKFKSYSGEENKRKSFPPPDVLSFYRSLLGLKLRFTKDELKNAYRGFAEKYHPDRYMSALKRDRENAETLMKQINVAYEILKEAV